MSARSHCPHCGERLTPYQEPLTSVQRIVLDFIDAYIAEHKVAPTFSAIAEEFGYKSLATVYEHLSNLERKGWITRSFNEERSIALVEASV